MLRNKQMLPMIFIMPIVQLLLLVYAATFEVDNVDYVLMEADKTRKSRQLADKFDASEFFTLVNVTQSDQQAHSLLERNEARMILKIPHDFEKDIVTGRQTKVQFIINAEDGMAAGIINSYSNAVALDFYKKLLPVTMTPEGKSFKSINIKERFWYNPELDYKQYMAPGILVILVTFIGMFLAGMNLVKEKEVGTIEQLNVTPIRKYQFIIGKLLPFWIIGLVLLGFGLILIKLFYNVPFEGNLLLFFFVTAIYLLVVLGAAVLISTVSETQQQTMFLSWFIVVVFIMMSGIFTPIDSMPVWAQKVTLFNPLAHFGEVIRRVLLKGAGFESIQLQFWILAAFAFLMISLSVWRFRKVGQPF